MRPELARDREGLAKLVRDFSWPGGFPSHLAPIVPGTIHEGGELGYALATAFGAALDNPDLIVRVRSSATARPRRARRPAPGTRTSSSTRRPRGAVLPILHLNGYKIANPTIFKSMSDEELTKLFEGYGWHPLIVAGRATSTPSWPRRWTRPTARSARSRSGCARRAGARSARAGR